LATLDSPSTVAITSTVPEPGGVVAAHEVVEEQETPVAGLLAPKEKLVCWGLVEKPVPDIVTEAPPSVDPLFGLIIVTVGGGTAPKTT